MNSEEKIVKLAQKGDASAMEILYTSNFKSLFKFVRHKVDTDERAEDIVSEAFYKAIKNITKFKFKSSFKSWIYTIAKNMVYDWYKKRDDNKEVKIKGMDELEDIEDKSKISVRDRKLLFKVMKELKANYREVLELRFISNMSVKDTAEIMNKTENNVKVTQKRAITKANNILKSLIVK